MIRLAVVLTLTWLFVASLGASPARADLSDKLGSLTAENAKGYLSPLPKALSSSLNSGIFSSGQVPRFGISIGVGIHLMGVSFGNSDRTFVPVDPPGFQSLAPTPVPTLIGDPNGAAVGGQGGTTMVYPGGFDISQFTIAAPEITVESVFGTRLVGRWFAANIGNSDYGKLELVGFGAQHSISQYLKMLPADVAVGAFYQTFKLGNGLLDTKATHIDVTASRKFGHVVFVQPYVSVGYDTFSMDVSYKDSSNPGNNISLSMDKQSNAHLAAGATVSLFIAKLQAEVFSAANTGASIGLTFGH